MERRVHFQSSDCKIDLPFCATIRVCKQVHSEVPALLCQAAARRLCKQARFSFSEYCCCSALGLLHPPIAIDRVTRFSPGMPGGRTRVSLQPQ